MQRAAVAALNTPKPRHRSNRRLHLYFEAILSDPVTERRLNSRVFVINGREIGPKSTLRAAINRLRIERVSLLTINSFAHSDGDSHSTADGPAIGGFELDYRGLLCLRPLPPRRSPASRSHSSQCPRPLRRSPCSPCTTACITRPHACMHHVHSHASHASHASHSTPHACTCNHHASPTMHSEAYRRRAGMPRGVCAAISSGRRP